MTHPSDQPAVELPASAIEGLRQAYTARVPDPAEAELLRVELGPDADRVINAFGAQNRRPVRP
jgi:hypothetical protein